MTASRGLQDLAFRRTRNRLLLIQAILVAVAAGIALPLQGNDFVLALLYGGATSLAGTLAAAWRLRRVTGRTTDAATANADMASAAGFYQSAALRFVVVLALLVLGFGILRLHGAGLLTGFIVATAGFLLGRPQRAR